MAAMRSRKEEKEYMRYLRAVDPTMCIFCASYKQDLITDGNHFKVIRNIFPYSFWDGHAVEDHLLVVPKHHTDSLDNLDGDQAIEFLNLITEYERHGYNVYARGPGSNAKSIIHQHTHLIKATGKSKKVLFMLRKPYIRFIA